MLAPHHVIGHVTDHDGFAALPDFMTDGRLDLQFAPRLQAKVDLIEDTARHPIALGHASDGCETHAARPRDSIENRWYGRNPANALDVFLKVVRHGSPGCSA